MTLTIFNVSNQQYKNPISPFNDKTFIFENIETNSNFQSYQVLVSYFTLNLPLNISKPLRLLKNNSSLKDFYSKTYNYLILDLECINNYNKNKIIEYFKDFKVIIGESRSYDGYTCFNLKGILFTEELTHNELKVLQAQIQADLKDFCHFNNDVLKRMYHTASILKSNILYNNENGFLAKKINKKVSDFIKNIDIDLDLDSSETIELCLETFKKLGYTFIKENLNGSYNFEFDGDNTYYWYKTNPYLMNNNDRQKSINIWNIVKKYENKLKDLSKFFTEYDGIHINEEFINPEPHKDIIEEFLFKKNGLLTIKSPMGTGKSNLISYIINEAHERDFRVLVVTNRVSIAKDFKEKYNLGFYQDRNLDKSKSLICQYDSLHRFRTQDFDLIILDEFLSLLLYSRENPTKIFKNFQNFIGLFNKKIILADAFLNGYENNILDKKSNIFNIINDYRDPTKLFEIPDEKTFFHYLDLFVKKDKKTTISIIGDQTLYAVKYFLESKNLNVITLTGNTPETTKQLIYEYCQKETHDKWDVLIYSPTLTVGVSILNDVENHFHFDCSRAVDVISSLQMIKRTRKAKNIFYFVNENKQIKCLNYNNLRDEYIKLADNEGKETELFKQNGYGETILREEGSIAIKIDLLMNIFKSDYKCIFKYFLNYHFLNDPIILESKYFDISKYKDLAKNITKEKIDKDTLNDFFKFINIEYNINNNKILKLLNLIYDKTNLNLSDAKDSKIFIKLIDAFNKNNNLFKEIGFFKLLNSHPNLVELNKRKVDALIKNNKEEYEFLDILSKTKMKYNSDITYTNQIEKDFQKLLKFSGFRIKEGRYILNPDILKFSRFLKF